MERVRHDVPAKACQSASESEKSVGSSQDSVPSLTVSHVPSCSFSLSYVVQIRRGKQGIEDNFVHLSTEDATQRLQNSVSIMCASGASFQIVASFEQAKLPSIEPDCEGKKTSITSPYLPEPLSIRARKGVVVAESQCVVVLGNSF